MSERRVLISAFYYQPLQTNRPLDGGSGAPRKSTYITVTDQVIARVEAMREQKKQLLEENSSEFFIII